MHRSGPEVVVKALAAVFVGAGVGALLRWWFSTLLNHLVPTLPPGTLLANLLGGYIIGIAMAITALGVNWSPEWRLLVVTGFCGGLTTFSTFSAEIVSLLQVGRLSSALFAAAAHLAGSILMTLAGVATVTWWRSA